MSTASDFLINTDNWLNNTHMPGVFEHIEAFADSIGATLSQKSRPGNGNPHLWHTGFYVPGYTRDGQPLFAVDDKFTDQMDKFAMMGAEQIKSYNMFVQNEYDAALGINFRAKSHAEDLAWVVRATRALMALGYAEIHTSEMIMLLQYEQAYGSGELDRPKTNRRGGWEGIMQFVRRPEHMLLDNAHAAGILASAKHLTPALRRKYMKLAIPAAELPAMIKPTIPLTYVKSLYPKRTHYEPRTSVVA